MNSRVGAMLKECEGALFEAVRNNSVVFKAYEIGLDYGLKSEQIALLALPELLKQLELHKNPAVVIDESKFLKELEGHRRKKKGRMSGLLGLPKKGEGI